MDTVLPVPSRILLVESDSSLESLLSMILREEGYSVSVAISLEEVPALLEEETFALVLADVFVGHIHPGSFTPAHRLRRLVRPTPLGLLMTVPFSPEEARRAGFAFVLPMPFDLAELFAEMASALQQPLSIEQQQRVQVVERYFAARKREDWQAMLDLCTEDIVFSPHGVSTVTTASRLQGRAAFGDFLVAAAQSARLPVFTHFWYTVVPKGVVVRYVRLWTTPEGERRREARAALFQFRGEQIARIGMLPLLAPLQRQAQAG